MKDEVTRTDAVRATARLAFAAAVVIAVAVQVPGLVGAQWSLFDTRIYLDGGHAVLTDPSSLYVTRWQGGFWFTYPPFAAVVFGVLDLLPATVATGLLTFGTVLASARTGLLVSRGLVDRVGAPWASAHRDAVAFVAAAALLMLSIVSEPVRGTIGFGQVNVILAWLVVEDFLGWGSKRPWRAGVLTGVAAGIKITPALLLIPRLFVGDWRGARNGVLAGVATVVLSASVTWTQTWDYYTRWLWDTTRPGDPWYAWNQSLVGTAYRVAGMDGASVLRWLLVGVAVVAGMYVTTAALRGGDRVGAVVLGSLTIYLVSPITWYHHLVLIPALLAWLVAIDATWPRPWRILIRIPAAVLVVSAITGLCKTVPSGGGAELSYSPWEFALVDAVPLAGLCLLVVMAGARISTRG